MTRSVIIGSRGSALALWQANYVKEHLAGLFPDKQFDIKVIRTTGDQLQDVALSKIGDKGLFTGHIETELLTGEIDLAVHSLKDLQTVQPDGLTIGAVCEREKPNDALISRWFSSIAELPQGASVATGSLRRRSQLLHKRPDLSIVEIRGNVPTRLNKYLESELDGMILAYAGLQRLNLRGEFSHLISTEMMLPAVGQGAVAVEVRNDDKVVLEMASKLNHSETSLCVAAERAFLKRLEGGCQVPIGALATIDGDSIKLDGMVSSLDGSVMYRDTKTGGIADSQRLGIGLAESLIGRGAEQLLAEARLQSADKAGAVL
ncbi:hydroxymethylbilane synthase [soil metagenome]